MASISRIVAAAAAAALAATFVFNTAMAKDYRLGTIVPPSHQWSKAAEAMGKMLSEASGGADTVTVFPAGQLGNESQMVQQLQTGALDMAFLTIADVSNRIPEFGALYAPFLVTNSEDAATLLRGPTAQEMLTKLPGEMGVVGVGYGLASMRQMMSTKPVEKWSDLQGAKMRITPFKPFKDFYSILGVAPTPMPLPDVYDALANGQVDAIDIDVELITNFKFYDRADHLLLTNHSMFPMVGLVSGKVWAGLSDDEKAIVSESMKKALDQTMKFYAEAEPQMIKKIEATGIEVKQVDRTFFPSVVEKWEDMWSDQKSSIDALRSEAAAL
ncbi:TRAP transporter substrate-binding protein [Oricola indica]|uniref:TRAP transporter substrate-binding protein n=1 Tax=Oricola indica TaxID=2872591 RepID=UPI003CCBEC83